MYSSSDKVEVQELPAGTQIVKLSYPIIFLNASRAKMFILDAVRTYHSGIPTAFTSKNKNPDKLWNELGERHILLLKRKAGISPSEAEYVPQIKVVVLDMQPVTYMDTTGIEALKEMKAELKAYAEDGVEIRMIGLKSSLVEKFKRAGWNIIYEHKSGRSELLEVGSSVVVFEGLRNALSAPRFLDVEGFEELGRKKAVVTRRE